MSRMLSDRSVRGDEGDRERDQRVLHPEAAAGRLPRTGRSSPRRSGSDSRFMSPTWRSSGLSATSTGTTNSPVAVSIRTSPAPPASLGLARRRDGGAASVVVSSVPETVVVGALDSSSSPPQAARRTRTTRRACPSHRSHRRKRTRFKMTVPRRGALGECEARTQGAFVAGGYGRNRGRRIAPSSAARRDKASS